MTKKLILTAIFFMILQFSFAQTKSISGIVVDEAGLPLMGATVLVKGTNIGTQTDLEGSYTISAEIGQTLIFSFIGMTSVEKKVTKNSAQIYVTLIQKSEELDEVVVTTGYQNVKKDRMTGSISVIGSKDIKNLNLQMVDQALTGRISGLSSTSSGRPGAEAKITIRGNNTLFGDSSPIWIIDGMPLQGEIPNISKLGGLSPSLFQNGLSNLSPDDIESITVLKDAAASAIYGARAANGVIVIKTKRGIEGKTTYNIIVNTGITTRPVNPLKLMNSKQKIQFEREYYNDTKNAYIGRVSYLLNQVEKGVISKQEAENEISKLEINSTNWFDVLYKPGFSSQISASMSGGNSKTRFYNSINYLNEEGTEHNNVYNRLRINTKLDHNFSNNLKIYSQLSITYKTNKQTASYINTFDYALKGNPYETPNGYDLSYDMSKRRDKNELAWKTLNVKSEILDNTRFSNYLDGNLSLNIEWTPIRGLVLTSQGAIYANGTSETTIENANSYTNFRNNWLRDALPRDTDIDPKQVKGALKEGSTRGRSFNLRNSISYTFDIKKNHFITLYLGQELSARETYAIENFSPIFNQKHRVVGYPQFEKDVNIDYINKALNKLGATGKFQSRLASFFFNGTYSYKDRYVVNGSIRYDGSNVIGNKNQFTPLWNTSTRWNLHNENFLSNISFIDELSLRVGYGFTGSIDKNAYPFIITGLDKLYEYDGLIVPNWFTYPNPNIKWQTKEDFNIGLDVALWEGMAQFRVNYYHNFIFDLLDDLKLPRSSGRNVVKKNVANLINKGWEFEATFSPIHKDNLFWNVRGNISYNQNIVTSTRYNNLNELPLLNDTNNLYFVENYPVGAWYGYKFAGIDPKTGNTQAYMKDGKKFDMNDLTSSDTPPELEYLGVRNPPITGGFSTDLIWKRWILTLNFEFKLGNMIRSYNTIGSTKTGNRNASDLNRWRAEGDITNIPKIGDNYSSYEKYMYDIKLEKGDYLRSTYCSVGYNFSNEILKIIGAKYARFTFSTNNIFTLTGYKGLDPMQLGDINYPNSKRYNLSLNFGF